MHQQQEAVNYIRERERERDNFHSEDERKHTKKDQKECIKTFTKMTSNFW